MAILKPQTKEELVDILSRVQVCADFDHSLIRKNSLRLAIAAYGIENLLRCNLRIPAKCAQLGIGYAWNKLRKRDSDQDTIRSRAEYVKGFPIGLFRDYALENLSLNENFVYAATELGKIDGIYKVMPIVTRNMESLVELYLDSTHEHSLPIHEYLHRLTGFDFIVLGNEMGVEVVEGELLTTGEIHPGHNTRHLLDDLLISMQNKIQIYSGKVVLSDREESGHREVRKQSDYYLVNLQVSKRKIKKIIEHAKEFFHKNND